MLSQNFRLQNVKKKYDLFELIQSLSKSEKRFFKVFSSRHVIKGQNNYVALFDAIEAQTTYDEEAILSQFKGEKMLNRFSVAKAYLYDLILKAMSVYHAQSTIDNQINELLRHVSFLYEKCLYTQAVVSLKKAKKIAKTYEKLTLLSEIIRWEKKIMEASLYLNNNLKDIELAHKEQTEVNEKIANLNEYWLLDAKLYHQNNTKGIARNREDMRELEYVLDSTLMQNEEKALSFDAGLLYHRVYATYFFILRDFESCYNRIKKMVDMMENSLELANSRPLTFVNAINNLLNMTQVLKKKEETEYYLSLLKERLEYDKLNFSARYQLRSFEAYFHHLLSFNLENGEPEKALPLVPKIKLGLQKFQHLLNPMGEAMMCYNVFLICFWSKSYEEAQKWLQRIINKQSEGIRPDIRYFAHLLDIITSYEIQPKTALLTIDNHSNFFKAVEPKNQFERLVKVKLKTVQTLKTKEETANFFAELKEELIKITLDPFEKKAFAYFDFNRWVNNHFSSNIQKK